MPVTKNQFDDFNAKNGYIGFATVIGASLAAVIWGRRRLSLALFGAALVGIVVSMGVNIPLYDNFEFLRKWFPERFLQPTVLFLALLAAAGVRSILLSNRLGQTLKVGLAVGLAGLIIVDSAPFLRYAVGDDEREKEVADAERVGDWLAVNGDPERRLFVFSIKDWSTNFAPIQRSGVSSTSGWNPEGTPHSRSIGNINAALASEQHGYVLRTLALWDAGYAFIDGEFQPHVSLARTMVEEGWRQVDLPFETTLVLYERPDAPGARILQNPLNIATIGEGGKAASVISPNVSDWSGYTNVIEDQDIEYLSMMDGVLLFGAQSRNRNTSEDALRPLLEQGITVYEEVSTSAGTRLFGMESERIDFQGSIIIRNAPGITLLPDEGVEVGPFAYQGGPWTAAVMSGEGEPLLVADINGETRVIVARRQIGAGQFVYIGLSLITHAETNRDHRAAEVVRKLLDFGSSTAMNPVPLPVQDLLWNNREISFGYSVARDTPALISLTYFPGWTAKIDGRPIKTFRHERLTLLNLPSGNHQVELSFGFTGTQRLASVLSIFSLIFLGGLYLPQSRRLGLYGQRAVAGWLTSALAIGAPSPPRVPGIVLQNGIRFDGAGTRRTHTVELEAGPKRMFLIGRTAVPASIVVRRAGQVVGQFDYSRPGEWFDLGELDDQVEFDVITAESHEWSLYLDTRPPEGPRAS